MGQFVLSKQRKCDALVTTGAELGPGQPVHPKPRTCDAYWDCATIHLSKTDGVYAATRLGKGYVAKRPNLLYPNRKVQYTQFTSRALIIEEQNIMHALEAAIPRAPCTHRHVPRLLCEDNQTLVISHAGVPLDLLEVPIGHEIPSVPLDYQMQMRCLAATLQTAKVFHLDMKCKNIAIDDQGIISLFDYDISGSTVPRDLAKRLTQGEMMPEASEIDDCVLRCLCKLRMRGSNVSASSPLSGRFIPALSSKTRVVVSPECPKRSKNWRYNVGRGNYCEAGGPS